MDTVPSATKEDVDKAVTSAKKAQKEWTKIPVYQRVEIMYKFIDLVERDKEDLARTLSDETGKPITEARAEIGNIPSPSLKGQSISTARPFRRGWRQDRTIPCLSLRRSLSA